MAAYLYVFQVYDYYVTAYVYVFQVFNYYMASYVYVFQVYNYFVAAGMHSRGIQGAGGVGKYISEMIVDGYPHFTNLWSSDIQRFVPHHSNKKFLRDRVKETIGTT